MQPTLPGSIHWYRRPWPSVVVAVVSVLALVAGLLLRLVVDPVPAEAVQALRQLALFGGVCAAQLTDLSVTTRPAITSRSGRRLRRLVLRFLPGADRPPPPPTAPARAWFPRTRAMALVAMCGAALWFVLAAVLWVISRLS